MRPALSMLTRGALANCNVQVELDEDERLDALVEFHPCFSSSLSLSLSLTRINRTIMYRLP